MGGNSIDEGSCLHINIVASRKNGPVSISPNKRRHGAERNAGGRKSIPTDSAARPVIDALDSHVDNRRGQISKLEGQGPSCKSFRRHLRWFRMLLRELIYRIITASLKLYLGIIYIISSPICPYRGEVASGKDLQHFNFNMVQAMQWYFCRFMDVQFCNNASCLDWVKLLKARSHHRSIEPRILFGRGRIHCHGGISQNSC